MLKLTKKGDKYWLFEDSEIGLFSPSKFTINLELNEIVIVYENGLKSKRYKVIDCEIYDLGELTPFTTSSGDLFMQKLEDLNCPCFQKNENIYNIFGGGSWGDIEGDISNQLDLQTSLNGKEDSLGFTPENVANKENTTLDTSTTKYPTNRLVKEAIDAVKDNVYRANFYVMSSTEASGLLFDGIVAINRFTEQGTRSIIAPTGGSRLLSLYFQNYLSATTAGACAGIKQINNADGYYRQGFDNYFIWGNNDANANCQTTIGHYSLFVSTMPNVAISAFTGDFVGVGNDVGDTNLSFYCRRVSGTNPTATYTKVSCGASFPANDTTSAYMLRMEAPQTEVDADRFVKLTITNLITGATATHTFEDADTPILDRPYATTIMRSNRATGVATNIKFGKIQVIRKVF